MSKGTYLGLRVLPPSSNELYRHCQQSGILVNHSSFERRLHCTVLYSRKPVSPWIVPDKETIHVATFNDYALFNHRDGEQTVLVVKLNAPSVFARHLKLMAEHGASFDYPVFTPHISLSHAFYGDFSKLQPFDFPLYLGHEYSEELDP